MKPGNFGFGVNDGAAVALAVSPSQNLIKRDDLQVLLDDLAQSVNAERACDREKRRILRTTKLEAHKP